MQRKRILALLFLAGISSVIYEIAWVRQSTLTFGVNIYAYSAVLTAYMGGIAVDRHQTRSRAGIWRSEDARALLDHEYQPDTPLRRP